MKNQYRAFIRDKSKGGTTWWIQNNTTGKKESLNTKDAKEAKRLLDLRNQPHHFNGFHVQMARTHLLVSDPESTTRTWQAVMDSIARKKAGSTKIRWERANKCKAFDSIRNLVVANTRSVDFEKVLDGCDVSTNTYLRRLHNFAQDMNWLLVPVIAKRAWPKIKYGDTPAITLAEHQKVIEREMNAERKAFYEVCWHVGCSQTDIANLRADNIDWQSRVISYVRQKTKTPAIMSIGQQLEQVLRTLPARRCGFSGPIRASWANHRASA